MKILIVAQNYPYPGVPHGGGQDLWRLIDFLRPRHSVYVATFDDPAAPIPHSALRPYVADLRIIRYSRNVPQRIHLFLTAVARGYRDWTMRRTEWEMRQVIHEWSSKYKIDVVQCSWTETGRYLRIAHHPKVRIFDAVDLRFVVEADAVHQRLLTADIAERHKHEELGYCRDADLVVTRSEADKESLHAHLPGIDCYVLPPVGNIERFLDIRLEESLPGRVLFCGAMNRAPNIDAVRWFADNVWPSVHTEVPDARFTILGAYPSPEVLALRQVPGIEVTGYVSDLLPYYAQTRVVVAPTRVAAGQLNKVMDGLAAGRPVVSTTVANRGTRAPCVIVRDEPESFANAVIEMLQDPAGWRAVAEQGRHYALTTFDWSRSVTQLEALYLNLIERPERRRLALGQALV